MARIKFSTYKNPLAHSPAFQHAKKDYRPIKTGTVSALKNLLAKRAAAVPAAAPAVVIKPRGKRTLKKFRQYRDIGADLHTPLGYAADGFNRYIKGYVKPKARIARYKNLQAKLAVNKIRKTGAFIKQLGKTYRVARDHLKPIKIQYRPSKEYVPKVPAEGNVAVRGYYRAIPHRVGRRGNRR